MLVYQRVMPNNKPDLGIVYWYILVPDVDH
jgi:hypothetical protein